MEDDFRPRTMWFAVYFIGGVSGFIVGLLIGWVIWR